MPRPFICFWIDPVQIYCPYKGPTNNPFPESATNRRNPEDSGGLGTAAAVLADVAAADPAVQTLLSYLRLVSVEIGHSEPLLRLRYLNLFQALDEVVFRCACKALRGRLEPLKRDPRWKCVRDHRADIAHLRVEHMDYERLRDLERLAAKAVGVVLQ